MMKNATLIVSALFVGLVLAGCSDSPGNTDRVPTKDDFKKTAPPAEWRGPGQPGGPASGPPPGPPAGATK